MSTQSIITDAAGLLDGLTNLNAAYNILYRLGYVPVNVPALTFDGARFWLELCAQVEAGDLSTDLHQLIAAKVPQHDRQRAAAMLANPLRMARKPPAKAVS
jgi:hypothetical protein